MGQRGGAQVGPTGPPPAVLGHSSLACLFSKEEGLFLAYKRKNY